MDYRFRGRGGAGNNVKSRLGLQTAQVKNTKFGGPAKNGASGRNFDIREKLSVQRKRQISDARDEISKKTKFADARVRIQNSQATKKPVDARDKIKSKQGSNVGNSNVVQPSPNGQQQQVMITGLSRVKHVGGHIVVDAPPPNSHLVYANAESIFVTAQNPYSQQQTQLFPDYSELDTDTKLPKVRIRNDLYQQPQLKVKVAAPRITSPTAAEPKPVATRIKPPVVATARPKPVPTIKTTVPARQRVSAPIRLTATKPILKQPVPVHTEEDDDLSIARGSEQGMPSLSDVVSPLQGFRVMVTNLHPSVTQEDIVELFSDIGALKKAKILKRGIAEVVFVRKQDAVGAVKRYHNRELDGMPMLLNLAGAAATKTTKAPPVASNVAAPPVASITVALPPKQALAPSKDSDVDISVIHKALFKTSTSTDAPTKPVTFTIKI